MRRFALWNLRPRSALLGLLLAVLATGISAASLITGKAGAEASTSLNGTIALTGGTCLCQGDSSQVYLLHLSSGKLIQLTHGPDEHGALGWSHDGSRLLVEEFDPGTERFGGLVSLRVSDSSQVQLAADEEWNEAEWSPSGARVAYLAASSGVAHALYVVNADGTHRQLLARGVQLYRPAFFRPSFSWAPNGRRIVFVSHTGLSTVTTRGKPFVRRIRFNPPPQSTYEPTWSPDGSRIAFTVGGAGRGVTVMRTDGSNVGIVHDGYGPVWSPNSAWLAFQGGVGDAVIHPDRTGWRTWKASWSGITFSPSSTKLAYVGGAGHEPNGDLFVASADGSNHPTRVLHVQSLYFYRPLWRGGTATTESG